MSNLMLLSFGGVFMLMLLGSGMMMLRQSRQQERFAARVRLIHGQAPAGKSWSGGTGSDQGGVDAGHWRNGPAHSAQRRAVGAARAPNLSIRWRRPACTARTVSRSISAAKIMLMAGLPALAWVTLHDANVPNLITTPLAAGGGRGGTDGAGLDSRDSGASDTRPSWRLVCPMRLDMMVICAQAGLGLGPAIVRVATELQSAHREVAAGTGADGQRTAAWSPTPRSR